MSNIKSQIRDIIIDFSNENLNEEDMKLIENNKENFEDLLEH